MTSRRSRLGMARLAVLLVASGEKREYRGEGSTRDDGCFLRPDSASGLACVGHPATALERPRSRDEADHGSPESSFNESQLLHGWHRQGDLFDGVSHLEHPPGLGDEWLDPAFGLQAFVKMLVAHHHNFTLFWTTELPTFRGLPTTASSPPDFSVTPQPWQRTGPGNASDGKLKFDLTKFNPAYFDRLRDRVQQFNAAGIYAGVYLFSGELLLRFRFSGDGYPLTGQIM